MEYLDKEEAERAIKEMDGQTLNDKVVHVDWAFWKGGKGAKKYFKFDIFTYKSLGHQLVVVVQRNFRVKIEIT